MPMYEDDTIRPNNIEIGEIIKQHADEFIRIGKLLNKNGLAIGTGGNLSVRVPGGLLVTSTKSSLAYLKSDEIIFVFASEDDKIFFVGQKKPSSETITHWEIYKMNPSANAIVHVNAGPKDGSDTLISETEIPYGTKDLGEDTGKLLIKRDVVMMKNHGMISTGDDLSHAAEKIIKNADRNKPYIFT